MDSLDQKKQKLERKMRNLDKKQNSIFSKYNVSDASKEEITRIQGSVEKKYQGGTDAGKQRKTRIVNKLAMNHKHASLLTSIYDCVASVQIICYVVLTGAASYPQNIS